ncbi:MULTISPECIES: DASS family sodium-coupled anion symporter [unclassified Shewanella]|uniref:SLC13 family permease n=1 Tax=unclassified Shewanella TaxID=196818 RepID=UPI000C832D3B|nr:MULTISPECIES: DASS family sodium-coupled anion symporter [unclassified Shewanella]MDO6619476.1 DASS family sodium-coupled anion symporter [Shewanella sp. 6_MG-2023]MDO6639430.1 DASS family sodium-coupled anion symporter [Shewanella sp. 5_MG-2023]MDO6678191.1 DASS family sodium-coupled anion symporter [Shewanella sp. 4_MG-2023]MDO6775930.1 DASS family sodium-coupled anion symporter [Shewanella sp. 3_MG-2023]PMG30287.1 Anion transporter [Shewanella sp. 10N.286.52.C2]
MENCPTKSTTTKNNKTDFIILFGNIALFALLYHLLPFEQGVNTGLSLLIFAAILWLTEAIHISITAILIPILAVFLGVFDTSTAMSNFANPIIFLFFGGFVLAAALNHQGIDRLIAQKVLLLSQGKLSIACMLLFLVTAVLSMWISNTATAAMMLPLALGILHQLDFKQYRKTYLFVLLGIAYSANIGGIGTLVGSPPNAIAAAQVGLSFSDWLEFGLITVAIMLPSMLIALYLFLKPDLSTVCEIKTENVKMTVSAKLTLIIFLATVCGWIFSKPLAQALGGISKFDTIVALGAVVVLASLKLVDWKKIESTTDWGVLILFGGGLTLSAVLKATGTSVFLAHFVTDIFGDAHMALFMIAVITFVVLLTEFASNTASAALLVPVFAAIAEPLGLSPVMISVVIGIAASCAFMLPVATPPNAIVFGSGYIKQSEMMRAGMIINFISMLVLFLITNLFWGF